jgi:hypothetical protein
MTVMIELAHKIIKTAVQCTTQEWTAMWQSPTSPKGTKAMMWLESREGPEAGAPGLAPPCAPSIASLHTSVAQSLPLREWMNVLPTSDLTERECSC